MMAYRGHGDLFFRTVIMRPVAAKLGDYNHLLQPKIQKDGDTLMTRAVFLIGVGIISAAIIVAALIISTSMPRPFSIPQNMRVITETRKCFELRRFVEAQKEYISKRIDQAAYQKMTPQEQIEADTSLGRDLGNLDDMLERAGCD